MRRFSVRELAVHTATGAIVGGGLAALLSTNASLPSWAPALPAILAVCYVGVRMRRYGRRLLCGEVFSAGVLEALERLVHFYKILSDESEKRRFARDVHYFLLDHHIEGVNQAIDDEIRAMVAASAVVLSFGLPDYEWETTRDILVYPSAFNEDYEQGPTGRRLGQVGSQGPIILSAEALRAGFAVGTDGHNVGFHEFAHVMDFDDGAADGIPANLNWAAARPWVDQMSSHLGAGGRGQRRRRVLRQYAYTNEAEFFACATEVFFERPQQLLARAPELHDLLEEFYGQGGGASQRRAR